MRDGEHGRIHVFRDVTASRRAKVIRETFIGMLSHELRTPITTVYGGTKVLARRSEQLLPEVRSIVADIEAESERLYRLVEDLVVLTKSESASLEAGREPVLLQRVVPRLVATEARRWPALKFHTSCPASLPPVLAEQTYVEQVVRNLLTNAAKYGGSAGTVEVEAGTEGDEVVIRVLDRGPGFPENDADRLFDIYYRSPSVARQAAGAGIGLFVCKSLVEAMGGRIWADDRPGGGATFAFALPAMAEPADMDEDDARD
jgi:two-component system sensor histidine kinase KdpD